MGPCFFPLFVVPRFLLQLPKKNQNGTPFRIAVPRLLGDPWLEQIEMIRLNLSGAPSKGYFF